MKVKLFGLLSLESDTAAVVFGVIVSTLLAGSLVIAGLKAGITPGVSPLVILIAWGGFATIATSGVGTRFLNLAQVAGSAGMAVTAGVIFTAPLVQILYAYKKLPVPPVDVITLIIVSLGGAFIGFGFVGLATKKFLTDPTLPAPEARACEAMIDAAVAQTSARPKLGRSLYLGLVLSFLAPLLARIGAASGELVFLQKTLHDSAGEDRNFKLGLPFEPIYIGIGGLLTLGTALLVFGGSFLRLIGDGMLTMVPTDMVATFPANSMRWVGGGAMTVAVGYSLLRFMGTRSPKVHAEIDYSVLEIDESMRRKLVACIVFGTALLVGWLIVEQGGLTGFGIAMSITILVMATLMVTLGAILSLQIGSSASPVSGTIFVTTLVLCLVALAVGHKTIDDVLVLTPLLVGACVAVCTANDSSQDYKTLQLCGVRVQDGFLAQLLGLIGGCIVVPVVVWFAHKVYTLGSDQLPAPQGKMFATLVDGLLLQSALPWGPILIGLAIGALAVFVDITASKRGVQLPSMALAVGIYLPAEIGIGILIGATCRWWAERGRKQTSESILAAAGLITGAAILELLLGVLIVSNKHFDPDKSLKLGMFEHFGAGKDVVCVLGIIALGYLLYYNSRRKSANGTESP